MRKVIPLTNSKKKVNLQLVSFNKILPTPYFIVKCIVVIKSNDMDFSSKKIRMALKIKLNLFTFILIFIYEYLTNTTLSYIGVMN